MMNMDDTENVQKRLNRIDKRLLTPLVKRSLGHSDFRVTQCG